MGRLEVSVDTVWRGEVRSWTGFEGYYYGDMLTDGTRLFWHLEWMAFYVGRFSDPSHMSGRMFNRLGGYGIWGAVKAGATEEPGLPGRSDVALGVRAAD